MRNKNHTTYFGERKNPSSFVPGPTGYRYILITECFIKVSSNIDLTPRIIYNRCRVTTCSCTINNIVRYTDRLQRTIENKLFGKKKRPSLSIVAAAQKYFINLPPILLKLSTKPAHYNYLLCCPLQCAETWIY